MKNVIILLFVFLFAGGILSGCGDDSESTPVVKDVRLLNGEWCMIYDGTANIMSLKNSHTVSVEVFQKGILSYTMSGAWNYVSKTDVLVMELVVNKGDILSSDTRSYRINELSENALTLVNQNLGSIEEYHKIVGTVSTNVNDLYAVDDNQKLGKVLKVLPGNVESVEVVSNNEVRTKEAGVFFILVEYEAGLGVVRIESKSNVSKYIEEVQGNIDDILTNYGEPDESGMIGQNPAILYEYETGAIGTVQYQYDGTTREVTRILTVYRDENEFKKDREYIESNFYEDEEQYFPNKNNYSSKYVLSPFEKDSEYYISYGNLPYLLENGHF